MADARYTGLWELLPLADDAQPLNQLQPPTELVESVRDLLANGLIAVFQGCQFDGDQELLAIDLEKTISNVAHWRPPENDMAHTRIAATPAGERVYFAK